MMLRPRRCKILEYTGGTVALAGEHTGGAVAHRMTGASALARRALGL